MVRAIELLRVWLENGTQVELAARLKAKVGRNVAQGQISRYAAGIDMPSGQIMAAMHDEIGIPISSWYEKSHTPLSPANLEHATHGRASSVAKL